MTRFTKSALVAALALPLVHTAFAKEVVYTLDPMHTQVDFSWNHMGFSTPAASVDQVKGTLRWDDANPAKSSVKVSMPVASIHSHVPALNEHLRSASFFDGAKHPEMQFESTKVERSGNQYKVHGKLTVRGITRNVVLDAKLNKADVNPMIKAPAVGFDATTVVRRSDFGMTEFLPAVSDDIKIRITTEAIEAKGFDKFLKEMAAAEKK